MVQSKLVDAGRFEAGTKELRSSHQWHFLPMMSPTLERNKVVHHGLAVSCAGLEFKESWTVGSTKLLRSYSSDVVKRWKFMEHSLQSVRSPHDLMKGLSKGGTLSISCHIYTMKNSVTQLFLHLLTGVSTRHGTSHGDSIPLSQCQ